LSFADHFSAKSDGYARSRPTYPEALFDFIASQAPGRERAWDCATGNGQAAVGLAKHFERVEATDASAAQIANAMAGDGVRYSVQPAEGTDFPAASFDAVCVAQALHWFDLPCFYAEAQRVLKPGGVFFSWGYDRMNISPELDAVFETAVLEPLRPHWPKENALLWRGYRDLPFPFMPIEPPKLAIEMRWSLAEIIAYVATWTASRRLSEMTGDGWLHDAKERLAAAWGDAPARIVSMPLHLRCGRRI
jgi:ubiquinone/menaquinone biosynthesis C-methylase UbiE